MLSDTAFLEAIRAEPEADVHRLAYADWLMEHEDPAQVARGEFIRVQCELASLAEDDTRRDALGERESELLRLHRVDWTDRAFVAWLKHPKRACRNPEGHRFCQVMAQGIAAQCDLNALPAEDRRRERLQKVIDTCGQKMDGLGYNPETCTLPLFDQGTFRRGFIDSAEMEDWVVQLFAEAIFDLSVLRELRIDNELTEDRADAALDALVRVGRRSELRELGLCISPEDPATIEELTESPFLSSLTRLRILLPEGFPDETLEALAASPHLANLRHLDFSCELPTDAMLLAILDSPHLAGLTELRIQDADQDTFSPDLLRRARKRFGRTLKGKPGILFTSARPSARKRA
jgi:uncharacterized protein (TIGR02996 family)